MARRALLFAILAAACGCGSSTSGSCDFKGEYAKLAEIRARHDACTVSTDCMASHARDGTCIDTGPDAVARSEESQFASETRASLDGFCAGCNSRIISLADGLPPVCRDFACDFAQGWECAGSLTGALTASTDGCGDGLLYQLDAGTPRIAVYLIGLDAGLLEPDLLVDLRWSGPPNLEVFPDGGTGHTYGLEAGYHTIGFDQLDSATASLQLLDGGTFVLQKLSRSDPGALGQATAVVAEDTSGYAYLVSVEATLVDPAAPTTRAVAVHLEPARP